VPPVIL